jgi:hypothetical protein
MFHATFLRGAIEAMPWVLVGMNSALEGPNQSLEPAADVALFLSFSHWSAVAHARRSAS